MMSFFREGGFPMYFVAAGAVLAIVAAVRGVVALRSAQAARPSSVDGVIFWGGFALLVGLLGTLVGFSQMARAIQGAGSVSPALLWGGVRVALTTTIAGCTTFVLALCTWASLRWLAARRIQTA